jgi:hypothetical protein
MDKLIEIGIMVGLLTLGASVALRIALWLERVNVKSPEKVNTNIEIAVAVGLTMWFMVYGRGCFGLFWPLYFFANLTIMTIVRWAWARKKLHEAGLNTAQE